MIKKKKSVKKNSPKKIKKTKAVRKDDKKLKKKSKQNVKKQKDKKSYRDYGKKALKDENIDKAFDWASLGVGIALFAFLYIISPLDIVSGFPWDDIVIGVLSIISVIISFVQSVRQKKSSQETLYSFEDKVGLAGSHFKSAKNTLTEQKKSKMLPENSSFDTDDFWNAAVERSNKHVEDVVKYGSVKAKQLEEERNRQAFEEFKALHNERNKR